MKKAVITTALSALLLFSAIFFPSSTAKAYSPAIDTIKVGLYYGSSALAGANLENEIGSGYRFGYFDSDRDFISVGASSSLTNISVVRDSNVCYLSGNYVAGTGSIEIGYFHVKIASGYSSYDSAASLASDYSKGFVRYDDGVYDVLYGSYTTQADAEAAAAELGLSSDDVDQGGNYTVAVVETGTSNILFEFDGEDTGRSLGIMPVSSGRAQTWFRGYTYYGGFQYERVTAGNITVVNVVDLEDYVKGVIPYEMNASWPLEALKVQACCARTFGMYCYLVEKHDNFDICNTTECQVYYGTNSATDYSDSAVDSTAGEYITYNGSLCQTVFSASDGGGTESSANVWGGELPYLQGVIDPYEVAIADEASPYKWTVTFSTSSLTNTLINYGYLSSGDTVYDLKVSEYSPSGNAIKITAYYYSSDGTYKTISFSGGSRICNVLDTYSIHFIINGSGAPTSSSTDIYVNGASEKLSDNLDSVYAIGSNGTMQIGSGTVYALTGSGTVEEVKGTTDLGGYYYDPDVSADYVISGTGWGHSVGMSQWGAHAMAEYYGKTYDEIIKFYYTGVSIG